jgi:DNA repair exonuclease SbcCD ATPase subunit
LEHARLQLQGQPDQVDPLPSDHAAAADLLERLQAELKQTDNDLHEAQGVLKSVGGSVAREHLDREAEILENLQKRAVDLELEYAAAKRLLDVLKDQEAKHAAHVGRSLAQPVTEAFVEFSSGRYSQVALDSGLRFQSIAAKGGDRELASLSVGTRDQLATLLRLVLSAHLKSVVVLDDQLAQSDPVRLRWFRDRIRASVREHQHQVIVVTCRPSDYLDEGELPDSSQTRFESQGGSLVALNLEHLCSCW